MREAPDHYQMKYHRTICYFPSKKQWLYVSGVGNDGSCRVYTADNLANNQEPSRADLKEVPYRLPPTGWMVVKETDLVGMFVQRVAHSFKVGICIDSGYLLYTGARPDRHRNGMEYIIAALNLLNKGTVIKAGHGNILSKNFTYYIGKIYWRNLEVGSLERDGDNEYIFNLSEPVIQEFQDHVKEAALINAIFGRKVPYTILPLNNPELIV